ncbi:MAG: IclR family transcriptional regulator [Candidatus Rokubacteria bacterium]|nr:IclR family transcriptional regulator [Candidatus Rokubacteria bacterium]
MADPSVVKAVRILAHVARDGASVSLADLSAAVKLPKPTVHRLAVLLEQQGFLHKDPLTRRYSIGWIFHDLCFHAIQSAPAHQDRQVLLQRLSEKLGETVNFGVLSGREVVYLERVESSWPLRMDFKPGSRVPMHCTAIGKLLLAFAPRRRREELLRSGPLKAHTGNTITKPSLLRRELLEIRRRGHSEDNEEFLVGVCCLAVPVKDRRGKTVAGLAVSAPSARFPLEKARAYLPDLQACAAELGAQTGRPGRILRVDEVRRW